MRCRHKLVDDGLRCPACVGGPGSSDPRDRYLHAHDHGTDGQRERESISRDIPTTPEPEPQRIEVDGEPEQVVLLRSIESLLRRLVDKAGA